MMKERERERERERGLLNILNLFQILDFQIFDKIKYII